MIAESKKTCTLCEETKSWRAFDISPRTQQLYPRCRQCRRGVSDRKADAGRTYLARRRQLEKTKRRCRICQVPFLPLTLFQKTCTCHCELVWQRLRPTLVELGPKQIISKEGPRILVDADDFDYLSQFEWAICSGYAKRSCHSDQDSFWLEMGHEIMELEIGNGWGRVLDHANRNKLDNRKTNLRICTQAQNVHNGPGKPNGSSRFKGVSWNKQSQHWRAYIVLEGKYQHLGQFIDEEEAARAYDAAANEAYGEYAYLNFPEEVEAIRA